MNSAHRTGTVDALSPLRDPDFGEFSPSQREYEGIAGDGVTETTVAAPAEQRHETVVIEPRRQW